MKIKKLANGRWRCDYYDHEGKRHRPSHFRSREAAQSYAAETHIDLRDGLYSSSEETVLDAGILWLADRKTKVGGNTYKSYRTVFWRHIAPFLGPRRLVELVSKPKLIRDFEMRLRQGEQPEPGMRQQLAGMLSQKHIKPEDKAAVERRLNGMARSEETIKNIMVRLGEILGDAQERGAIKRNPVRDLLRKRNDYSVKRKRKELGVDIPYPEEMDRLVAVLMDKDHYYGGSDGRQALAVLLDRWTGLRAGELRALSWPDLDLNEEKLQVRHAIKEKLVDGKTVAYIGPPKSEAGRRTIRLMPFLIPLLKEWKLACPKDPDRKLELVFPTRNGKIQTYQNLLMSGLMPAAIRAGLAWPKKGKDGNVQTNKRGQIKYQLKYPGLHALRHFFISWCANREKDGGLELPLPIVTKLAGHTSTQFTQDVYGHLFPNDDYADEFAKADRLLSIRLGEVREQSTGIVDLGSRRKERDYASHRGADGTWKK
jgi:integrase